MSTASKQRNEKRPTFCIKDDMKKRPIRVVGRRKLQKPKSRRDKIREAVKAKRNVVNSIKFLAYGHTS